MHQVLSTRQMYWHHVTHWVPGTGHCTGHRAPAPSLSQCSLCRIPARVPLLEPFLGLVPGDPAGNLAGGTSPSADSVPVPSLSRATGCSLCLGYPQSQSVLSQAAGASDTWLHPSVLAGGTGGRWHSQWGQRGVFVFPAMKGAGGVLAGGGHSPRRAAGRGSGITEFQPSAPATYWGCPHAPCARGGHKATCNPRASLSCECPPCLSFPTHKMKPVVISQQEKPDPAAHRDSHQGSVTISASSPTLSLPQALSSPPHYRPRLWPDGSVFPLFP